jgi:serine protease AprX
MSWSRGCLPLLAAAVLLTPAGVAGASSGSGRSHADAKPASLAKVVALPAQGDRDGDHVSDDFEARLRAAPADRRLPVIITGLRALNAQRAVGSVRVTRELPLIDGFAATMRASQARALARVPGVRRVEADATAWALDDATNNDFGATAARADQPGLDGAGVGICIVDTGVDPNHEQIAPRTVTFKDFVNGRVAAYDDHGHGTHVAGIAAGDGIGGPDAATFVGVAPGASLFAAKVLNSAGSGTTSNIVAGIQWCHAQPDVDVISMSLGGGGGDGTDALSVAVDQAVAGGEVVVVAAGNSGDAPETVTAPGVARSAITVGAVSDYSAPVGTDRHDDGIWLAGFSSRGPTSDGRIKPDIASPGVTVRSAKAGTTNEYATFSGTSMATPYVAGAVALALQANPSATPDQIKSALMASALDMGPIGTDNDWGAGLIDVRAFVDTVAGASPVDTTGFPTHTRVTGTVPNNGSVDVPIDVSSTGLGVPLAATVLIDGQPICTLFCLGSEWSPDLDVKLLAPDGSVLATSDCALSGLSCGIGRQETMGIRPAVAGTYILRVTAFTGDPNNGKGGAFAVDIMRGPLTTAEPPPPPPPPNEPPVADAGPDLTVRAASGGKATFTLDGTASSDPDGVITAYRWTKGTTSTQVGTTAKVTLKRGVGTYTFRLRVTDDDGATDTDSVTVTVLKRR